VEMIVDMFAGGGGASLGITQALGVPVDLAVNHDQDAMAMHWMNHPRTRHECADIYNVDPAQATAGRPVGLLWASPDCTHFSRAKGGKPVKKNIRSLAWVVVRWAKAVRPRVIILENVPEFRMWGPLTKDSVPDKRRKGETFKLWCEQLRALGYELESKDLRACDYGAPTIRKRLFVIARCDGRPIVWPEPTHWEGKLPYHTAAECIDWSLPCPSIFLTKEEAKAWGVRRPLAEKTLARIARGIRKFVIESGDPFIIKFRQGATGQTIHEPMHTITAGSYVKRPAGAGHAMGLVTPYLYNLTHGGRLEKAEEPLRTITTAHRGEKALVAPYLINYHGAKGQEARGQNLRDPLRTQDTFNRFGLVAAHMTRYYGQSVGSSVDTPSPTASAQNHDALVTSYLTKFYGTTTGSDPRQPMPTVTGGGQHIGEVRAFLLKYFNTAVGQSCREPAHTITAKHRLGLVTVAGHDYQIADIGLRMLTPRELARAQGFPDTYHLTGTKSCQVAKIGNSVCPPIAAALVKANVRLREAARADVG